MARASIPDTKFSPRSFSSSVFPNSIVNPTFFISSSSCFRYKKSHSRIGMAMYCPFRRICATINDQSRSFRSKSSIASVVYFPSLISWFLQFSSPFIMMFCSSSVSLILYFFIILSTDPFLIFFIIYCDLISCKCANKNHTPIFSREIAIKYDTLY